MIVTFAVIVFISGCGDVSDSEDSERPKVVNVSIMEGGTISSNTPIFVTFDKTMKSAEISVYEHACGQYAQGQTELYGDTAKWTWSTYTPPGFDWGFPLMYSGNCTLTVTGIDESDQELAKSDPIDFKVTAPG